MAASQSCFGNANQKSKNDTGLPGGPVVKNPPANAGDTGSIPVQEDPHATEQLNPCSTITQPAHLKPPQEKPPQWEVLAHRNSRKPARRNKDPAQPKNGTKNEL